MNLSKKKLNIIFILILFILFIILSSALSASFFYIDDTYSSEMNEITFLNIFNNPINFNYFSGFFDRFFGFYLPKVFNMHPSDFKSFIFCYIQAAIVLFLIFIWNSVYFIKKKISCLYILSFVFLIMLLFYVIQLQHIILYCYDGFFRMLVPTFIFMASISLIIRLFKDTKNFSMLQYFILGTCTFLSCISNEMICAISVILYICLTITTLIKKKGPQDKQILITLFYMLSLQAIALFIFKDAFFRKTEQTIDLAYIYEIIKLLPEFLSLFFKQIIIKHIIPLSIFALSIFILLKKRVNDTYSSRIIYLVSYAFLGTIFFFIMLLGLGKTHYSGNFWLVHDELNIIYDIILYTLIFILVKLCFELSIVKPKHKYTYLLVIAIFFLGINNIIYYTYIYNWLNTLKVETYKAEKILRIATVKDNIAYLDKNLLNENCLWHVAPDTYWEEKKEDIIDKLYFTSPYIRIMDEFDGSQKFNGMGYIFTSLDKVEKEFMENGGEFSDKELKHPIFTKLFDKDFLFNRNK